MKDAKIRMKLKQSRVKTVLELCRVRMKGNGFHFSCLNRSIARAFDFLQKLGAVVKVPDGEKYGANTYILIPSSWVWDRDKVSKFLRKESICGM